MAKSCDNCKYFQSKYQFRGWCGRYPKWEELPLGRICGEHKIVPKTPKEKKNTDEKWLIFYNAYPRKIGRGRVIEWFDKYQPSSKDIERMLNCIKLQSAPPSGRLYITEAMKKQGKMKFVPLPKTWLNDGDWRDAPMNAEIGERAEKAKQESASKRRLTTLKAIDDKRQKVGEYFEEQPTKVLQQIVEDNKLDELTLCIVKETLERKVQEGKAKLRR